jgi:hypothetical protein
MSGPTQTEEEDPMERGMKEIESWDGSPEPAPEPTERDFIARDMIDGWYGDTDWDSIPPHRQAAALRTADVIMAGIAARAASTE